MGKRSREQKSRPSAPQAPSPATPAPRTITAAIVVALLLLVFAIYGQCFHHQFTLFDDPEYVVENDHVNQGLSLASVAWAFTSFYGSNWHPLTWISHMTDVELFGLDAGNHHAVNVLFHATNALLLFFILRRATRRRWPSAAVAALFAAHPLHVESVAWISERKDVLSTLFFFLTLAFWVAWVQTGKRSRYWLAVAMCALGLMAKPMLVTMPFVLLLVDWWPLERRLTRTSVIEKWPFFALSIASSAITLRAQEHAIGAVSLSSRVSNALLSYADYLGKTFWPVRLSPIYAYRLSVTLEAALLAIALLVAITAAVFLLARRFPFLCSGWLWYLGTLVPVIGIVQVGRQAEADRYTYIPLIGIFIAVVWLADALVRSRAALATAAAVVIPALAIAAHGQASYWRDGVTLFEHAVAVTKNNPLAHSGLGIELLGVGQYKRAADELHIALTMMPRDDYFHERLGVALLQLGDQATAQRELETAAAINPRNARAIRLLGDIAFAEGDPAKATALYEKSAKVDPVPTTRAALAAMRGKTDEAIALYRQAVARQPLRPELHNDLAALLARSGHDTEAVSEYEEALRLAPLQYDARMNLGTLLIRLQRTDEAVAHFERAAQSRPESPEPHIYLALVFARTGRTAEAIREASTARAINPESANLQFTGALHMPPSPSNLDGWIEYMKKKVSESVSQ